MNADRIKEHLGKTYGYDIIVYDTLDSTNTEAKRLAEDKVNSNSVIIADYQTAGRGRLGRQFYSPKGIGLYMSFLIKADFPPEQTVLITTAASVAVCRAIERAAGVQPKIKWVNDLYLNGRKICGILAESVNNFKTGRIEYIIIGIGINCGKMDFPDEIRDIAGSVGSVDRNRLAAEVIREMNQIFDMISNRNFLDEYRQKSLVIGKRIKILGENPYFAEAVDIDDLGGLVIRTEDGDIKTLVSGEISIRLCGDNKQ